jgi:hypothetical protein
MYWIVQLLFVLLVVLTFLLLRQGRKPFGVLAVGVGLVAFGGLLTLLLGVSGGAGFFAAARVWRDLLFVVLPTLFLSCGYFVDQRRARWALWSMAGLLMVVGAYATFVEPRWLEVTHQELRSSKVEQPLRIVLVSDLQTDRWGAWERRVIEEIVAQEPDLVLFSGDYVQAGGERYQQVAAALERELRRMEEEHDEPFGRLGAWAIQGDVERAGWSRLFAGTSVRALEESSRTELGEVVLTTLAVHDSRSPLSGESAPIRPADAFHVVVGHAPDFALGSAPADLLLAGHVHGGQVRLPFLGPIVTLTAVPRAWAVGRTELDGDRVLIVSRGLGMERGRAPRLRFLCRPELVVIDVLPSR